MDNLTILVIKVDDIKLVNKYKYIVQININLLFRKEFFL